MDTLYYRIKLVRRERTNKSKRYNWNNHPCMLNTTTSTAVTTTVTPTISTTTSTTSTTTIFKAPKLKPKVPPQLTEFISLVVKNNLHASCTILNISDKRTIVCAPDINNVIASYEEITNFYNANDEFAKNHFADMLYYCASKENYNMIAHMKNHFNLTANEIEYYLIPFNTHKRFRS